MKIQGVEDDLALAIEMSLRDHQEASSHPASKPHSTEPSVQRYQINERFYGHLDSEGDEDDEDLQLAMAYSLSEIEAAGKQGAGVHGSNDNKSGQEDRTIQGIQGINGETLRSTSQVAVTESSGIIQGTKEKEVPSAEAEGISQGAKEKGLKTKIEDTASKSKRGDQESYDGTEKLTVQDRELEMAERKGEKQKFKTSLDPKMVPDSGVAKDDGHIRDAKKKHANSRCLII